MLEVTKVMLYSRRKAPHILTFCSVVLNDSLKLNDIQLCANDEGRFLILPSRQDMYKTVEVLNKDKKLVLPEVHRSAENSSGKKNDKKFEEFFHPLDKKLYVELLTACSNAYDALNGTEETVWRPTRK